LECAINHLTFLLVAGHFIVCDVVLSLYAL